MPRPCCARTAGGRPPLGGVPPAPPRRGPALLDVGLGPGHDHRGPGPPGGRGRGPRGRPPRAADLTRAELERQGVTNATVVVGDAHDLDLGEAAGGGFDVVHAHQVLQHVADPVGALREMLRVTRPGGVVAVRDSDYGHFSWHPASQGLDRWLACTPPPPAPTEESRTRAGCCSRGRTPPAHRRARRLSTRCFATPEDRRWWGGLVGRPAHRHRAGPPVARRGSCDPR